MTYVPVVGAELSFTSLVVRNMANNLHRRQLLSKAISEY